VASEVEKKIEAFFASYKLSSFDKGHILIQAGDEPAGIFHLISGQVRQYDISNQGDKAVVNVFRPPAFFPMSWAINKTPNQYFFETATVGTYRMAPSEDAVEFLRANPDVTFDLLRRVYLGTDVLLRRMTHLMGGSAKTRILYELLLEGRYFGQQQPNGTYIVSIHVNELAARTGLSRETVSREIAKIKNLGIKVKLGAIEVKNLKVLEEELGDSL
jgi:CRP/FNR family transcriptional regulator, dissimilatory nitrate respiration regulator